MQSAAGGAIACLALSLPFAGGALLPVDDLVPRLDPLIGAEHQYLNVPFLAQKEKIIIKLTALS
jgi:hypothetical protein